MSIAQSDFVAFESALVSPLEISPDGTQLFAVNVPDNRLEIFDIGLAGLTHVDSVPVGMEPVSVRARTDHELWVVNHLSDSVSVIDLSTSPARVRATLLVGDEPRDVRFAGTDRGRAFITTAHRGQHRLHYSIAEPFCALPHINGCVPGAGDPQFLTAGVPRADVWVYDALALAEDTTLGGRPLEILSFFSDTPRALAVSPDGSKVYVAAHFSGNQTTTIGEPGVCDGFEDADVPCDGPGLWGNPGPSDNFLGAQAPEVGLIVRFNRVSGHWEDELGRNWDPMVPFNLPDHDVFEIDANDLSLGVLQEFDHVGTILFNMAVNPVTGKLYVTNTESPNHVRFEGEGAHAAGMVPGPTTVQGHISETRITVIDPVSGTVDPQHLNLHIDYGRLHTDVPDLVDTSQVQHSLATPQDIVVSSDGTKIYMAAFGSSKVGVFDAADIEDSNFESNFDPTVESANYIDVDGGPGGLALDENNGRLYVLTRFNNSVSVIPLPAGSGPTQTLALHNPEPESVINGRPVLYDATTTSGNGEASCASCHISGDLDHLAWDLGDPDGMVSVNNQPAVFQPENTFHPMKGPMTTQSLRGLATHGAMHWRGDRVSGFFGQDQCEDPVIASPTLLVPGPFVSGCDEENVVNCSPCNEERSFMNFIVAFEGLLGRDGIIIEADMQRFTDFILQVVYPPNPVRSLDNSLSFQQATGKNIFTDPVSDILGSCDKCHALNPKEGFFGSNSLQTFDAGTQNVKVPHLRNDYTKVGMFGVTGFGLPNGGDQVRGFGVLKNGAVDTLARFVGADAFTLTGQEESDVVQFLLAFDSDLPPVVGQQVTLTAANEVWVNDRIDLMVARASTPFESMILGGTVTECDLVAKGTVGGVERGWVRLANGLFADDMGGTITEADLRALAVTEGPITFTAVPPGSGNRIGIERDRDGLLDGVETNTGHFVSVTDTGTNPALADSDGDSFDDGLEVSSGTDPTNAFSFPGGGGVGLPALPGLGIILVGLALGAAGSLLSRHRRGSGSR